MILLIVGLVLFLGSHSAKFAVAGWREATIARVGEARWKGVYSLISLVGLVLIVWGFAGARADAPHLWTPPSWGRGATALLMLASLILFAGSGFKRGHIAVAVHHPMTWGVVCFGLGHLLANGSLADLLLFGGFLVWGLATLTGAYGRDRADAVVYPQPQWSATIGNLAAGLVVWAVIGRWLHLWVIGVSPMG